MKDNKYFIKIANIVKERSGCTRRKVGAVFVKDGRIVSTGYNQAPSGVKHCDEVGCTIIDGHCVRALHAELNGILGAVKVGQSLQDTVVYCTTVPCFRCLGALKNAGVWQIYYDTEYENANPTGKESELATEITGTALIGSGKVMPVMRLCD